jgi:alpha/beta superfamily hydrolase
MKEVLNIAGPAGTLEGRLTGPDEPLSALAILCHPHPLYGGSMDDMVLDVLAGVLEHMGIACLRFNFRGVGASAGSHDGNGGEAEDLAAVIGWAGATYPEASLILGGYSFGASTVCRLLAAGGLPAVERVLLIAPPVGNLPVPEPVNGVPTDVFAGDADAFVDQQALAAWQHAEVHLLPGADHFFGGRWQELAAAIQTALDR